MSEEKDLNKKVDDLKEAKEKYLSENTVISIGGYAFTPAKLMIAFTIVSSTLGGLYGAFEVYKDYIGMKKKIAEYVTPDLTEIYKKLEVVETSSSKTVEYSQDIKNDLKNDIRRLEALLETIERRNSTAIREVDSNVKDTKKEVDSTIKEVRRYSDQTIKEVNQELTRNQKETQAEIRAIRKEVDDKIKKALDNPLAN